MYDFAEHIRRQHEQQREEYHNFLKSCPREKIFCFDTETTGINQADELLQFSAVDGYGRTLIDTYVRPIYHESWPQAQHVNGITPEMVKNAPTAKDITAKVQELWDNAILIVGYNVNFDLRYIPCDTFKKTTKKRYYCDVMQLFAEIYGEKNYYGKYKYQKLLTCAKYYNIENHKAHNSLSDCITTIECFHQIILSGDIDKVE